MTIQAANPNPFEKCPDIVLYVNGIALGLLEFKRSTVLVAASSGTHRARAKALS